jgi:hypothetical protein
MSPRVFARLCIRADPWRGSAEGAGGERDDDRGDEATELAVAAGAAMLVARRPG